MTREEAIKELKILREDYWEDDGYGHETIQNDDTMFALDMAIKSLEAWEKIKDELKYELCKEVHKKDGNIPCPNQTTSCSYVGLHIYELNEIINHVIDKHLSEVSE